MRRTLEEVGVLDGQAEEVGGDHDARALLCRRPGGVALPARLAVDALAHGRDEACVLVDGGLARRLAQLDELGADGELVRRGEHVDELREGRLLLEGVEVLRGRRVEDAVLGELARAVPPATLWREERRVSSAPCWTATIWGNRDARRGQEARRREGGRRRQ